MPSRFDINAPSFKRQMISLIVVIGLLIGAWYAYSVVMAQIWQSNKYDRQDSLDEADYNNLELNPVYPEPPGFSIDPSGFNMDPETMQRLMEFLAGNPALLNALLENLDPELLNYPLFHVFPDPGASIDMFDFWRITAYDRYSGVGSTWSHSSGATKDLSLIDRFAGSYEETYVIKYPFGETSETAVMLPTAYSAPHIDGAPGFHPNIQDISFKEDTDGGVKADFTLNPPSSGNLTYGLAKDSYPGDSYYASVSGYPSDVPQSIRDVYLYIPGGLNNYRSQNPNFDLHYNYIQGNITSQGASTVYEIADLIRTYLADNFELDTNTSQGFDRPDDNEDQVEWFLARGRGLPMDFASAYVLFCRAFNVPARYAEGYNSLLGEDHGSYYTVTLGCMYAWAEIFIPYNGYGEFAPLIIYHDGLIGGLILDPDLIGSQGTLNIKINGVFSNFTAGTRGMSFTYGCYLNRTDGDNAGKTIEFIDYNDDVVLATNTTDGTGYCEFTLNFDSNFVVGAHVLIFKQTLFVQNISIAILIDDMVVYLDSLNPQEVDLNPNLNLNVTHVVASIFDPENGKPVKNTVLHPIVVSGTSPIQGSVVPSGIRVNNLGKIDTDVEISDMVSIGQYDFRVDFNGSYEFDDPYTGEPQQFDTPPPYNAVVGFSSNTLPFNVTNTDDKKVIATINGIDPNSANIITKRGQNLNLYVKLERVGNPVQGENVEFYDETADPSTPFAILTTGPSGDASYIYTIPSGVSSKWSAGPHKIYVRWVEEDRINQTWYIVINETVSVSLNVDPDTINRKDIAPETTIAQGSLIDSLTSQPIQSGEILLTFILGISDRSSAFSPYPAVQNTDNSGTFSFTINPNDDAPLGTYSVIATFTGRFFLDGILFDMSSSLATNSLSSSLTVNDPTEIKIYFSIDGTPTLSDYTSTPPPTKLRSNSVTFQIQLFQSGAPAQGQTVTFKDETTDVVLGTRNTNSGGYATFSIPNFFSANYMGGLNLFSVEYNGVKNYTQILIQDSSITDYITSSPAGMEYTRTQDIVSVSGFFRDSYGNNIKNAQVRLVVETTGNIDVTNMISDWISAGGSQQFTSSSNGQFLFQFRFPSNMKGVYDIHVELTGVFQDNNPYCPANTINFAMTDNTPDYTCSVYAKITITSYYSPEAVLMGQPIHVWGSVQYDNGTAVSGVNVNITFLDASFQPCASNSWQLGAVSGGNFDEYITITWGNSEHIKVIFEKDTINYIGYAYNFATYSG
ncbi:MAG: transglutaminase-like domain-containing protein [Promethearchaeota archaeon]